LSWHFANLTSIWQVWWVFVFIDDIWITNTFFVYIVNSKANFQCLHSWNLNFTLFFVYIAHFNANFKCYLNRWNLNFAQFEFGESKKWRKTVNVVTCRTRQTHQTRQAFYGILVKFWTCSEMTFYVTIQTCHICQKPFLKKMWLPLPNSCKWWASLSNAARVAIA
jgi:hypothetical protein